MRQLIEAEGGRVHKLTSLDTPRRIRNYRPDTELPPADLEIDTDSSDASRPSASIVEHFG